MTTAKDLADAVEEIGEVPCQNYPDLFFPERDEANQYLVKTAQKLCQDCPINLICLDYALTAGETHGIWGGTTGNQRKTIRQRRGLTPKQEWK